LLKHRVANAHPHVPTRILVDLKIAGQLAGRDALLGVQHERDRKEPLLKGQMSVMEDRIDGDAESGIAAVAVMPEFLRHWSNAVGFAIRTDWFSLPANPFNMSYAISFGRELPINRDDVHGYPLLRQS
jgi:hypothetical protein